LRRDQPEVTIANDPAGALIYLGASASCILLFHAITASVQQHSGWTCALFTTRFIQTEPAFRRRIAIGSIFYN
jgi:hypothetical protein